MEGWQFVLSFQCRLSRSRKTDFDFVLAGAAERLGQVDDEAIVEFFHDERVAAGALDDLGGGKIGVCEFGLISIGLRLGVPGLAVY